MFHKSRWNRIEMRSKLAEWNENHEHTLPHHIQATSELNDLTEMYRIGTSLSELTGV